MTDSVQICSESSAQQVQIVESTTTPMQVLDDGGNALGGFPVVVANPQVNDVISYNGAVFRNRAQTELTDGGNF